MLCSGILGAKKKPAPKLYPGAGFSWKRATGLLTGLQQFPVFFIDQNGITQILVEAALGNIFR